MVALAHPGAGGELQAASVCAKTQAPATQDAGSAKVRRTSLLAHTADGGLVHAVAHDPQCDALELRSVSHPLAPDASQSPHPVSQT